MRKKITLFHYTTGIHYKKIISSRVLLTENETTPYALRPGEKGFLWFTASPDWEPTANKMWNNKDGTNMSLTTEETEEICNGLYRFGVYLSPSFIHWKSLKGKIEYKLYNVLKEIAIESGSDPNLWYVSSKPVAIERCCRIERYNNGKWIASSS
ncbi:MAG TPA: hypothetical protein PKB02_10635 [Anaerohalosphaeraceae bacterium]|nr:hypothetical protein [Anaerohalosphaeraceae bacterium]